MFVGASLPTSDLIVADPGSNLENVDRIHNQLPSMIREDIVVKNDEVVWVGGDEQPAQLVPGLLYKLMPEDNGLNGLAASNFKVIYIYIDR